uniref:lipoprotein insertase outer membrane protein LolB n=1 Tax=Thaumasiovibrio occultus TaxID=1891184 RepID=UPI000B35A295|nr:lipoprotein insertase outer membrane protein LolB [Thaumasiovibrio occultus]
MFSNFQHRINQIRYLTLGLGALLTTGCVTLAPPTQTEWDKHQAQLDAISTYTATGSLAYRDQTQRYSSSLFWAHEPDKDRIRLTSFVGKTILSVEKTPALTSITDADGQTYLGHDINEMTYQLTGLALPFSELGDWLLGLPNGADSYTLNEYQRLQDVTIMLDGEPWVLTYDQYDYALTPAMPTKLTLKSSDRTILIRIKQWKTE